MDRHRIDAAHLVTPGFYQCPACRITLRMRIDWPHWECAACQCRLVPADQPQFEGRPALQIVVQDEEPPAAAPRPLRRTSLERPAGGD
jgi:ribosomal protein L37AE/L43A